MVKAVPELSMRPQIDYGTRSACDAVDWLCECGRTNPKVQKLIFAVPTFVCPCGKKYLDYHDFDFCLANVTINGQHLVQRVLDQHWRPECVAYACIQALQIMYVVDCLLKKKKPVRGKVKLDPADLYCKYYMKYPYMKDGCEDLHIVPDARHQFMRMAMMLKSRGISLGKGKYYAIGDTCTISKDDYQKMCEELADGVPLLAVFIPGVSFGGLEYCRMYFPADVYETAKCNQKPEPHEWHQSHMVVLIGPAFRNGVRGFFFINSYGEIWCPREILEQTPRPVGGGILSSISTIFGSIPQPVRGGIGKVHVTGLMWNPIKLCRRGESAGERRLREEDEDENDEIQKYKTSKYNIQLLCYH